MTGRNEKDLSGHSEKRIREQDMERKNSRISFFFFTLKDYFFPFEIMIYSLLAAKILDRTNVSLTQLFLIATTY